jgi:hypothetical protein
MDPYSVHSVGAQRVLGGGPFAEKLRIPCKVYLGSGGGCFTDPVQELPGRPDRDRGFPRD